MAIIISVKRLMSRKWKTYDKIATIELVIEEVRNNAKRTKDILYNHANLLSKW